MTQCYLVVLGLIVRLDLQTQRIQVRSRERMQVGIQEDREGREGKRDEKGQRQEHRLPRGRRIAILEPAHPSASGVGHLHQVGREVTQSNLEGRAFGSWRPARREKAETTK